MMKIARRTFLKQLTTGTLLTTGLLATALPARAACQRASGAGSYQVGPYDPPESGGDPVYLTADFGFDETMAFCKISTNFAPFLFPTARLDVVEFGAHEFYMEMRSVSIDSLSLEEGDNGLVAGFGGVLRSETRLFTGERQRTYVEEAVTFGCEASEPSASPNIAASSTDFVMTVHFDPLHEHAAIFGENPAFGGRLTKGNIVVQA
jgi:hypothetical protein